jgi:hypothetical protein
VQLNLLVTYTMPPYDGQSQFSNALVVEAIVQRQSVLESYKGLGILQMIASFATPSVTVPQILPNAATS